MPYYRRVKKKPPAYARIAIKEKRRRNVRLATAFGLALLLVAFAWWLFREALLAL